MEIEWNPSPTPPVTLPSVAVTTMPCFRIVPSTAARAGSAISTSCRYHSAKPSIQRR